MRRCCVRPEAWPPQHVEDGQRIEIARMQQLLAERRLGLGEERLQMPCLVLDLAPRHG